MQLNHALHQLASKKETQPSACAAGSKYIVDEINAYIAIRDGLLVEAEQLMTPAKIDSAAVANNFVFTCLKPARPPYQAQSLPKSQAAHEGRRCEKIRARLAKLSAQIAARKSSRQYAAAH